MNIMLQVSWDWRLDSSVLFTAVCYLDYYLQHRLVMLKE